MGEAKRKAGRQVEVVYHHTSTLRTNLIWMSGVIELEGNSKGAMHPQLGEIQTDVKARRACSDFPPLAWFSRSTVIPRCLQDVGFQFLSKEDGSQVDIDLGIDRRLLANGLALNRIALGFPLEGNSIMPWREHYGYHTAEGQQLNDSARDVGDDPDFWYVSETPVDVMTATEVWISPSRRNPRLERHPTYLADVHRMVIKCREEDGVYIPPSWLTPAQARELARSVGVSVSDG